jgi:hypothetical protein
LIVDLEAGRYQLQVATTYGPRIVSLRLAEGPELFARLPEHVVIEYPDSGVYRFHGGHRLWVAPEVPAVSYASDEHACEVTSSAGGFTVRAPADLARFVKEIQVTSQGDGLLVDHRLTNAGQEPVEAAPWSITQFPLGGTALLPVAGLGAGDPFQADASVILWPYTNMADPRLSWIGRLALIEATVGPRFKIGSAPRPGRLGYHREGYLFFKEVPASNGGAYSDRGAVGQIFVEDNFCELESLGPLTSLQPGESLSHRETWKAAECASLGLACEQIFDGVAA